MNTISCCKLNDIKYDYLCDHCNFSFAKKIHEKMQVIKAGNYLESRED